MSFFARFWRRAGSDRARTVAILLSHERSACGQPDLLGRCGRNSSPHWASISRRPGQCRHADGPRCDPLHPRIEILIPHAEIRLAVS